MKIHLFKVLAFFIILCLPVFAYAENSADDGGWRETKSYKGFKVFMRKEPDSKILGVKVTGEIDAALPAIMANLRDVEGTASWAPDVSKKITLKDVSDLKAITWSVNEMPWPLDKRIMILSNELKFDPSRRLLFVLSKSVNFPDVPEEKGSVLADVRYSNIGFRPITANRTYVELTAFGDPKGSVPSWLVNFVQRKWPVNLLRSLEARSQRVGPPLRPGLQRELDDLLRHMGLPKNYYK